jgi:hypothetical protein
MGTPMTPFFPPAPAFIPGLVVISATLSAAGTYNITAEQAKNNVFRITGTASSSSPWNVSFPTTGQTKDYVIQNAWTGTGLVVLGTAGTFNFQVFSGLTMTAALTLGTTPALNASSATSVVYP